MPDFSSLQSSIKLVGSDSSNLEQSDSSSPLSLVGEGVHSALYSAVQSPVSGVAQLIDKTTGTNLMPSVQIIDAPSHAEFGSAKWHAQTIGGAAGMIAPFMLARSGSKAVLGRAGLAYEASSLVAPTANMITRARQLAVLESATAGFVFDSVMKPVEDGEGNFWAARLKHGTVGALTFGGLTASSIGFKSAASSLLKEGAVKNVLESNISNAIVSGVPAGVINAEASSLLFHGKLATGRELGESVYTMAVAGGALSALHAIPGHEKSNVQRSIDRSSAPGLTATEFLGANRAQNSSSLAGKMSALIGSGQTGQGSLNTRIAERFKSALRGADEFMASINPLLLMQQSQPGLAMATAYGSHGEFSARANSSRSNSNRASDFGGRALMSSMLEEAGGTGAIAGGKGSEGAKISSGSPETGFPRGKQEVDLEAASGVTPRRGRTFINEEYEGAKARRERETERAEGKETAKAWKVFELEGHPEVAEYIRSHPKLRNLKVVEEPLSRTGNDHPLVLEVLPGKEFPEGAVMKFAIPEGGWMNEWGNRSFDAKLLGKVREVDVQSSSGYLYFQELVDISTRLDPEKLNHVMEKIERDGKSLEDPGGKGPAGQFGVSRTTGELVLVDYMAVGKKGSERTLQELIYGQRMIEEEYDAENLAHREGRIEPEQPRDDMQVKSAARNQLAPEALNEFQRDVLEQLTSGISVKEVTEFAVLMDQGKSDPAAIKKEVQRIHAAAKKQGLLN